MNKFKVGDIVKCTDAVNCPQLMLGKKYTIDEVDQPEKGGVHLYEFPGYFPPSRFELVQYTPHPQVAALTLKQFKMATKEQLLAAGWVDNGNNYFSHPDNRDGIVDEMTKNFGKEVLYGFYQGYKYSKEMSEEWCLANKTDTWTWKRAGQQVTMTIKPPVNYKQAFRDAVAYLDPGAIKRLQKLHPDCFED